MKKNDEFIIDITDVTNEGSGVGKYEGMAVFVPLTAVGDTVKVKALKVKKTYAFGKLIEIISPSIDRIENDCESFNKCGGCVYRHISYEAECKLKENKVYEVIKRIGGVDMKPQPIIPSISIYGYRNKAQYPVSGEGKVGFYAFHSHRIIPCADCSLQPRIFSKIVAVTEDWIKENNISIYEEEKHRGLLRHIYLRLAEVTNEIMFTAVINGDKLPFADRLIESLKSLCGENLKSVQININKKDTNVILGDKCEVLYGEPYITDVLCGIKVRLSALSFYQVNRTMAEKLYEKAAEYAKPEGRNILDLYCGAGTIGLSMAGSAKSIIGVEIIPEAIADAEFNARNNGIKNAEFICGDATTAANDLKKRKIHPNTVIVDPPRKGCTPELIATITNDFSPERVVYVSCDPATLARDIKIFGENGYSLIEYTPVDLFPRTSHVETVVLLSRKDVYERIKFDVNVEDLQGRASSTATYSEISPLDEKGNFNFKKHVKHISQLVAMQDRYAKAMERFGLERGNTRWAEVENGKMKPTSDIVRHRPLRAWRADLLKQISAMQEQLQQLPEITESQQKALRELQRLQQQVENKKGTKKKLDAEVEDLQKDVAHLTGKKQALTTEIKDLQKATEEEKIRYLNLKADSEKLSGEIAMKRRELTEYVFSDRNSVPEVPRGTLHLGEADDILDL